MINNKKVITAVETICSSGCVSVNAIILTLESGNKIDGLDDFTDAEINDLKKELKSIMAVYDARPVACPDDTALKAPSKILS